MSPPIFFGSLLIFWFLLYLVYPFWLVLWGRVLSAGLIQLVGAFLPGIWHGLFWPEEAGNFGMVMMMLVPLPLFLITLGLILLLVRWAKWAIRAARNL